MAIDPEYVNSLSIEELRRELTDFANNWYDLMDALRDAPEMPPGWLLKELGQAAKYPDDNAKGKELQSIYDDLPDDDLRRVNGQLRAARYAIPFKSECEGGAGLWWRIRRGLAPATLLASQVALRAERDAAISKVSRNEKAMDIIERAAAYLGPDMERLKVAERRVAALEGALQLIPPSFIEIFMSKRRWRAAASIDIKARKDSTEAWIEGDWLKPFIRAIAALRPAETGEPT